MIRHYEKQGLLPEPNRTSGGYRDYAVADVHRLRIVKLATDLGIPAVNVTRLLELAGKREADDPELQKAVDAVDEELSRRAEALDALMSSVDFVLDRGADAEAQAGRIQEQVMSSGVTVIDLQARDRARALA